MRHIRRKVLGIGTLLLACCGGCTRTHYRIDADREAHEVIAERNTDPRWSVPGHSIEIDPRSRFFDKYDPDHPPMPPDDPDAQRYMRVVDGIEGWEHWNTNGVREEIENPAWRAALSEYVEVGENGAVMLDVDSALELAYLHSPFRQHQLETLYLSALDVTRERFRLDTRYFGGYGVQFTDTDTDHNGRAVVGRESGANPALEASRLFAAGGELLAGFANSFVFELSGSDPGNFTASLINFAFVQPLLRGAGKDVALEQLTLAERNLLGNLRSYSQFRQGFYTQVVIGELGVAGPRRSGPGVDVAVSRSRDGVDGYLGLLQQLQRIRNTEDNLDLQLRTLAQLEANLAAGLIDLVQVDQFRQNIENERANLLAARNRLERSLDDYKTSTLGLPPDLAIDLDDSPIRQFQFVARDASDIQDEVARLQSRTGGLPGNAPAEPVREILGDLSDLLERIERHLGTVREDLEAMDEAVDARERGTNEKDREASRLERAQIRERLTTVVQQLEQAGTTLEGLTQQLLSDSRETAIRGVVVLLGDLLRIVQGSILVQARARLETISIESIDLQSGDAFEIALANRLDFMNARSALVDSWRSIQFNADALQSELNLTASGELRTSGDSAADFEAPNHSVHLGLELDSPFTRLVERNNYRESLINYQRSRRSFIQSRASLQLTLRTLLRDIEQLRTTLEIQRRAVVIAIRRVDLTRAELYAPVRPPQPGQRPTQFGPTAAINLLSALSSLRDTQNSFLDVWLNYYAARLRLFRELGIMQLDEEGRWIDSMFPGAESANAMSPLMRVRGRSEVAAKVPPPIPAAWARKANASAEPSQTRRKTRSDPGARGAGGGTK